jgi:hypothetical protein
LTRKIERSHGSLSDIAEHMPPGRRAALVGAAAPDGNGDGNGEVTVASAYTTVSLLCVFTHKRISEPAITKRCKHPPCWCKQSWETYRFPNCPALGCDVKKVARDEIEVSHHLKETFAKVPNNVDRIEYNSETGAWRPAQTTRYGKKRKSAEPGPGPRKNQCAGSWNPGPGSSELCPLCLDSDDD